MTYDEALSYLHNTLRFGIRPGFVRLRPLLERLGNPHKGLRYVHVAGTNGKGSTVATIASILRTAGYKTGMYISPYLEDFRERISINGVLIPREDVARLTERVKAAADDMQESGLEHPTEFEMVTAIGFLYFNEQKCDYVVLEVGLGGLHDATNIIDPPEAAVIASISFDHVHILGNTLAEIAANKAGIIKKGSRIICYPDQKEEAMAVIREKAAAEGCPLIVPRTEDITDIHESIRGASFRYGSIPLSTRLAGRHQLLNTITAVETACVLGIPEEVIIQGVKATTFPGRFEVLREHPLTIIDGGHNPGGVATTVDSIERFLKGRRLVTIMGMVRDKDYAPCIRRIAGLSDVLIAVPPQDKRALTAEEIAAEARSACSDVRALDDIGEAVKLGLTIAGPEDVLLCCGSLYLIGAARTLLKEPHFDKKSE